MKTLYICSTREQAERIAKEKNIDFTESVKLIRWTNHSLVYYGTESVKDYEWLFDKIVHVGEEQKDISQRIHDWAADKGILEKATPLNQWDKTLEEVMELKEALIAQANGLEYFINSKGQRVHTETEIKDGIGDIRVTIDIQAKMQNTTLEHCSELAYEVISKRKGKMIDGKFVKDE